MWGWLRQRRRVALLGRGHRHIRHGAISSECAVYGDHDKCPGPAVGAMMPSMRCVCPCHDMSNRVVGERREREPEPDWHYYREYDDEEELDGRTS